MIRFENVTKGFRTPDGQRKMIFRNVSLEIPSRVSVGLLGRNGAGKSTLLDMIGGRVPVDSGRITTTGSMSWPVGFSGSFHGEMTGAQNIRFIARVYGVDTDDLIAFVADFAEIGSHMQLPVRTYSSGMKSRLVFGVSLGIPFDTYLVDEVTAVGDAVFRKKSQEVFTWRMKEAGAVVVSHSMPELQRLCQAGIVLEDGHVTYHDDINAAIRHHRRNLHAAQTAAAEEED